MPLITIDSECRHGTMLYLENRPTGVTVDDSGMTDDELDLELAKTALTQPEIYRILLAVFLRSDLDPVSLNDHFVEALGNTTPERIRNAFARLSRRSNTKTTDTGVGSD